MTDHTENVSPTVSAPPIEVPSAQSGGHAVRAERIGLLSISLGIAGLGARGKRR